VVYFDNSATTLRKPPAVAQAAAFAIENFGNSGRSVCGAAMDAARGIYAARAEIARLIGINNPLAVAFTSSATESLNLVLNGLLTPADHAITTIAEHNSVLRTLYQTGCDISFADCDKLEKAIKPNTKLMVATHGSNITGNINNVEQMAEFCKSKGIIFVLDIAQTFGIIPVHISMADIFCFTGHKGLFGPQGTGGIIAQNLPPMRITKTGGSGSNSAARTQPNTMPDIFEAGTANTPGIYGLLHGVQFINNVGINTIHSREMELLRGFYNGIKNNSKITIYGNFDNDNRLPIISINAEGISAADFSARLWDDFAIATRAGSHCAPLLHKHFGTDKIGMLRFSFSHYNTPEEIEFGINAVNTIVGG